jgi:hypothetical protein
MFDEAHFVLVFTIATAARPSSSTRGNPAGQCWNAYRDLGDKIVEEYRVIARDEAPHSKGESFLRDWFEVVIYKDEYSLIYDFTFFLINTLSSLSVMVTKNYPCFNIFLAGPEPERRTDENNLRFHCLKIQNLKLPQNLFRSSSRLLHSFKPLLTEYHWRSYF